MSPIVLIWGKLPFFSYRGCAWFASGSLFLGTVVRHRGDLAWPTQIRQSRSGPAAMELNVRFHREADIVPARAMSANDAKLPKETREAGQLQPV